ncbi:hypothetical protein GGI43DRAFT_20572 [Trichoderma evansii]
MPPPLRNPPCPELRIDTQNPMTIGSAISRAQPTCTRPRYMANSTAADESFSLPANLVATAEQHIHTCPPTYVHHVHACTHA